MKNKLLLVASLILIDGSPLDHKVDAMFSRWNASTPGLVVAAERDGKVVLQRAYGSADLRFGLPMRINDRFNVGSIAKQFTAYAVYDLIASGKIRSVDDPIGMYVPGLSTLIGSIPIRNLLEHTSGLRDYFALAAMAGITLEDALDTAGVIRLANAQDATNFPVGTDYEYSNTNYVLLAEAVRHVTGMSLGEYLHARVFAPLGMTQTQLVVSHGMPVHNLVSSYWPSEGRGFVEREALLDIQGDGNLVTNAGDLLRWEENLNTKAFGRQTIERMLDRGVLPGKRPASDRFVNGLFVERFGGFDRISADGGIGGFRAIATTFPGARVSVVALTNLIVTFPQAEVDAISADLLGIRIPGDTSPSTLPSAPAHAAGVDLHSYVGRYVGSEIDSTYWICAAAGAGLTVRTLRTPPMALRRVEGDLFTGDSWWLSNVEFVRSSGKVEQLDISGRSAHGIRLQRVSDSCSTDLQAP